MSPALSRRTLGRLRSYLLWDLKAPSPLLRREWQECVDELERSLRAKRSVKASRSRAAAKKKTRRQEVAELREQVAMRADGMCEACSVRGLESSGTEMDHFFGGNGRRRALQSRFTCWLLCSGHHVEKTKGLPSVEHWLVRFRDHCKAKAADVEDYLFANAYLDAANMAQARLDSLTAQGRTGEQT